MDFLGKKIEDFDLILKSAVEKYKPRKILVGFTGGSDSLTLIHLLMRNGINFQPFFCNTGIGVEEQWEFIRSYCKKHGLALIEQKVVYKTYKQMVLVNGFPGPAQHTIMYRNLKEKSIRFINDYFNRDTIIISGVRVSESERRKINISSPIQEIDKIRWVSPMMNWDDDDKEEFAEDFWIKKSPVSQCLGMSFECACGAYAEKGEKQKIKDCGFNKLHDQITEIEETLFRVGFTWGWDDPVPEGKEYIGIMEKIFPGWSELKSHKNAVTKMKKKKAQDLFMPMCHKCEFNHKIDQQKSDAMKTEP